jgi:hypothetical protein
MKNGGAAFPVCSKFPGELRDWFAGQALMGFMASDTDFSDHVEIVAETAYKLAGAMLEAREKTV